ncbi:TPA: hypothetical protein N0F65_002952 [Lagenidium giganteum]|uniref:Uncharacterized protein n=1 Tax=Lagenidium giganteum TaxID=4803 RepID=A0AAV2Z680_9STRA|nr:TPA: hypothetical protein N0F65_002952 [Lagenidium giganteum]
MALFRIKRVGVCTIRRGHGWGRYRDNGSSHVVLAHVKRSAGTGTVLGLAVIVHGSVRRVSGCRHLASLETCGFSPPSFHHQDIQRRRPAIEIEE